MKAYSITSKISKRVKITIFLSIVSLLSIVLYIIHHTYAYIAPPALIYIPDQNSTASLLNELKRQGVPLNLLDYRLLKKYPYPKEGWIRFDQKAKLHREELIKALQTKQREKTRRVVMYGGDSIELFSKRTAKQTNLVAGDIIKAYRKLSPYKDGGIMAGYYQIPYKTTPSAIAYYTISVSEKNFKEIAEKYDIKYSSKKWHRALTIASIIQKETQASKEMPLISSVIHNRLKRDMKLQLDATLNYGRYSNRPITPQRIKNDKSRFNTYLHRGLPPHPLSSVSKSAILAALNPANTNYIYFMLADNGTHNFAATYEDHIYHIKWYQLQRDKNSTEQNSTNEVLGTIPQKVITSHE